MYQLYIQYDSYACNKQDSDIYSFENHEITNNMKFKRDEKLKKKSRIF